MQNDLISLFFIGKFLEDYCLTLTFILHSYVSSADSSLLSLFTFETELEQTIVILEKQELSIEYKP